MGATQQLVYGRFGGAVQISVVAFDVEGNTGVRSDPSELVRFVEAPIVTFTPLSTPTSAPTATATPTFTPTATATATATPTATPTSTPTSTPTYTFSGTPTTTPTSEFKCADLDEDGVVGFKDFMSLSRQYGQRDCIGSR